MTSVLISVPSGDETIHKHCAFALANLREDGRFEQRVIIPTHRPFENNLHHIIEEWMQGSQEDYWLTFDNDNPPIKNPLDLIKYDKDIIGCPTPVWHNTKKGERPWYFNVYSEDVEAGAYRSWLDVNPPRKGEAVEDVGLHRVDAVGTGCVLIARRVFENPRMREGAFQRTYYADGRVEKGNDIAFCERARREGFEIWAHFGYLCHHFNTLDLIEVIRAFSALSARGN